MSKSLCKTLVQACMLVGLSVSATAFASNNGNHGNNGNAPSVPPGLAKKMNIDSAGSSFKQTASAAPVSAPSGIKVSLTGSTMTGGTNGGYPPPIPEPETMALMLAGLTFGAARAIKHRKDKNKRAG